MNRPRFISSSSPQSVRHFISYVSMSCPPRKADAMEDMRPKV